MLPCRTLRSIRHMSPARRISTSSPTVVSTRAADHDGELLVLGMDVERRGRPIRRDVPSDQGYVSSFEDGPQKIRPHAMKGACAKAEYDRLHHFRTFPSGGCAAAALGRASAALLDAPDLLVLVAVAVIGIEPALSAAVRIDVVLGDEVDLGHVAAGLLARERAVQFIHGLPALQVERFRDGADLIFALANAIIGRGAAVAGGDQVGTAVRGHAVRSQRGHGKVEVEVVEREHVAELAPRTSEAGRS